MKSLKLFLSELFFRVLRHRQFYRVDTQIKRGGVTVGAYTYGLYNMNIREFRGTKVDIEIGKFCSLADNITFITGGIHPTNWVSTYPLSERFLKDGEKYYTENMPSSNGKIRIGNDVWIASDVTIMSGVTIGNGAVIAAGAVVTCDVPPYAVYGGIPAKIIRYRFTEAQIDALQELQWWNWDYEQIKQHISLLSSADIDQFLQHAGMRKKDNKR